MRTTRYQMVPSKIDRRRPIEGESTIDGRLREIGDRRKRKEEDEKKQNHYRHRPRAVVAHGSPTRCRRPHPRAIFLSREETERLPARGERSR
ncbi:hypothetical protein B296_00024846 [Ensete ventricosum]|uniref:Uncharacterized protein n=1 Tax=Ensete ventricosum TaxID=4639 RepID=A0A427AM50_ENSVE|nr:hypothetical protein B296_00024846 [Ensete ventricosum]